jgi:hypothetical protein
MKAVAASVATAALTENANYSSSGSSAAKTPSSIVRSRFAEQHPVPTRSSSSVGVPLDALQQSTGAYSLKQQPLHNAYVHNSGTNSSLNSSSSGTPAAVLAHTGCSAVPHNAAAITTSSNYTSTSNSKQLHAAPLQRSSPPAGSSTDKLSLSFTKQDPTPLQSIAEVPSPGEQCGGESPDTGASLWPYTSTTTATTAAANATAAAAGAVGTTAHNSSVLNNSALNISACSNSSTSSCSSHSSHGGSTSSSSTGCLTAGGSAVRPCANSGGSAEAPTSSSVAAAAPAAALSAHRRAHSGHSPGSESGYGESTVGLHSAFSRLLSTDNVVEVNGIPYVRMDCIGRGGSSKVCGHWLLLYIVTVHTVASVCRVHSYSNESSAVFAVLPFRRYCSHCYLKNALKSVTS